MDKLRLEIRAMDELHQDMRDLADTMSRLSLLPSNFEGKQKVKISSASNKLICKPFLNIC